MLICVAVAFAMALLLAKPQGMTLATVQAMDLEELITRFGFPEDFTREQAVQTWTEAWWVPSRLCAVPTGLVMAAVAAAYLVGYCLNRPVIASLYVGQSRTRAALELHGAVLTMTVAWSLLLSAAALVCYGGFEAPALQLVRYFGWRLFFDLASASLVAGLGYASREPYVPLCVGMVLAVMTTLLQLLREELWWLPPYAASSVLRTGADWRLVLPSAVMLIAAPLLGVGVLRRMECK